MSTSTQNDTASHSSSRHDPPGVPAFVWGYNARAGLGLGHVAQVTKPTATHLPAGTVAVEGGVNFTVALTRDGKLYAWGGNQYGQLGDGTTKLRWEPTQVKLPHGVHAAGVAAGTDHVVARTTSGDVYAWGRNHRGQVGNAGTVDQHAPIRVDLGGRSAHAVAAGNGISAAITRGGDLYLWGRNTYGQLGLGTSHDPSTGALPQTRPAKAQLPHGADAVAVDAGNHHVAIALRDGRLMIFGLDADGRSTEGTLALKSAWGRPVGLWAGEDYTLVLTSRHTLLAVGGNASGQLGVGDQARRLQPSVVTLHGARGHVVDVWAGARCAAALTSDGQVFTWGDGSAGQHGAGPVTAEQALQATPKPVKALAKTKAATISGGEHHLIVTTSTHAHHVEDGTNR